MSDLVTVTLLGVRPEGVLDLLAAIDSLHREVQVVAIGTEADVVPSSVADGLVHDRGRLEAQRHGIHDQAVAARAAGAAVVDITVRYRPDEVVRVRSATAAVGAANAAAQDGRLLVPPLTPAQERLWRFMDEQFERAVAGEPPTPYVGDG